MTKRLKTEDRSLFTTIVAGFLGIIIAITTFLILPVKNLTDGILIFIGAALVIMCVVTAIGGRKRTVRDIIHSLSFWG